MKKLWKVLIALVLLGVGDSFLSSAILTVFRFLLNLIVL